MSLRIGKFVHFGPSISAGKDPPLELPFTTGLLQDLDAERGVSTDPVTGKVATWADQSDNNNDATQTTDANQPAFAAANTNFNRRPSVNGDGIAYWMQIDSVATALTGDDIPFYIIMAGRWLSTPSADVTIWGLNSSISTTDFHYLRADSTPEWESIRREAGGGAISVTGGTPNTSTAIIEYVFDGTTTKIIIDGIEVANAAQNVASLSLDRAQLFARRPGASADTFGDIEIARIATYTTVPSDANKETLRKAFSAWYGIAIT